MPLDQRPYQTETRGQIEAWLEQIKARPDTENANMLVTRRLVSHGLAMYDQIEAMRERLLAAEGETRVARSAAVREECRRIHFADESRRAMECLRTIIGKVAMAHDPALFAEVMLCVDTAGLPTLGLDEQEVKQAQSDAEYSEDYYRGLNA